MSALKFFCFAIMLAIAPVIPFIAARWFLQIVSVVKALRVLSRERRTGETLYDCAEAVVGDAHNWRGMMIPAPAVSFEQADGRINRTNQTGQKIIAFDERKGITSIVAPQPTPVNGSGPALWPLIISELGDSETDRLLASDMQARDEFGRAKYGVPLVASNGRDHLADAYQEVLDFVVYLRAAFDEDAQARHDSAKIVSSGVIGMSGVEYTRHSIRTRGGHVHLLYVDAIDMARDVRELIRERDGR